MIILFLLHEFPPFSLREPVGRAALRAALVRVCNSQPQNPTGGLDVQQSHVSLRKNSCCRPRSDSPARVRSSFHEVVSP